MKVVRGIKLGGLQQKIFNLVLIFIIALVGVFLAYGIVQQHRLTKVVETTGAEQQQSIQTVSEETMEAVLSAAMTKATNLQAYIANDLFADVRSDVSTLQSFATQLFANERSFSAHAFSPPSKANDGKPSVQMQHEVGVDPASSKSLGLVANMSEIMLSMFNSSDKISSCFVATPDGCILFADDRAGSYFDESGNVLNFAVRSRPWYKQAVEAGELIFTGVETDAFTDIIGVVCAAPVYKNGELVAVVGADIFLTSISDYVNSTASDGGFICIVNENGQVLFSGSESETLMPQLSADAQDLRKSENKDLAAFVSKALETGSGIEQLKVDETEYYVCASPMETLGWAVISAVEKSAIYQPTELMLQNYVDINDASLDSYRSSAKTSTVMLVAVMLFLFLLASAAALILASRTVKPIEQMTRRIQVLSGSNNLFKMEDVYKTGDEIEILAESFAELSGKTVNYIKQITEITAEKERIRTELSLATRIQADMLPSIYPAFPDRTEFDIYATMDPAREIGGDFYDFFLVDDDHLCMLIADVSGKGIPAALFMMASRIILSNNAKIGMTPAQILNATNETICQNNREEMFVTVWLGILEISTGKLTAANAGHEYPVLMKNGGEFEIVKDKHGFVIGGMEGIKYKEYELTLQPGSKLFLYTDGVPEATNSEKELFGTDRMLEALNKNKDESCRDLLKNIRAEVDDFVKDAEQFDDLTMLTMEYNGS